MSQCRNKNRLEESIMKEYKWFGGKMTIDGDSIFIKEGLLKENCTFSDIVSLKWIEPEIAQSGKIEISTQKWSNPPHSILFSKKNRDLFVELYDLIAEKTGVSRPLHEEKQAKAQKHAERIKQMDEAGTAYCPKCKSTSLSADKKGFGIGKAVVGAALTGGVGLMAGNIGAKKVRITCLKCGHQFWAGKG